MAVPAVAAIGVLRSGRASPRLGGRARPVRRRVSLFLAWEAVPAGLAADVALRRASDVEEEGWLSVISVIYSALLVVGIAAVLVLRRFTSTRAALAALGIAAVATGPFLIAVGSVGVALATTPLLLGAAAAYPPASMRDV